VLGTSGSIFVSFPGDAFVVRRAGDYEVNTYTVSNAYVCQDYSTPTFDWWVKSISYNPNNVVTVILYSYVYLTSFRDNVFLYGSRASGTQIASQDNNGYYRWPVQAFFSWHPSNVLGFPPYLWHTTMQVYTGSGTAPANTIDLSNGQTLYFSLFWSPSPRSTNFTSTAQGEQCGLGYAPGASPYGDAHGPFGFGGPLNPATPFPITSTFGAGTMGSL
jgi:hypothetical protein